MSDERTEIMDDDVRDIIERLTRIEDAVKATKESHDVVKEILMGNGQPSKGLVMRVDRVEQRHKLMWGGVLAAIGAGFASAVEWLRHFFAGSS